MPEFARSITVAQMLEEKGKELSLELLCGCEYVNREIVKPSINRPGLALDGHLENFRAEAIQIMGRGEYAFCAKLSYKKLKANL
ncbi:MAG: hypothetical protein ACI352_02260, partial [Elusimicrobiaceae bacterium]